MKRADMRNWNMICFSLVMRGMYMAAAGYCAWGILNGTVSYGTMTAMMQMINHLQSPFSGIGTYFTQWYAMLSSAERLMEAEQLPEDVLLRDTGYDFFLAGSGISSQVLFSNSRA